MVTIPLQAKTTISTPTAGTGVDISPSTYGFVSGTPPTNLRIWLRVYGADPSSSLAAMVQIQSSTNAFNPRHLQPPSGANRRDCCVGRHRIRRRREHGVSHQFVDCFGGTK
jgi:hypothetical protein